MADVLTRVEDRNENVKLIDPHWLADNEDLTSLRF